MHIDYDDIDIKIPIGLKKVTLSHRSSKNKTNVSQDMEQKIISMYAKGMMAADIENRSHKFLNIDVSDTTTSRINDIFLPLMNSHSFQIQNNSAKKGTTNIHRNVCHDQNAG